MSLSRTLFSSVLIAVLWNASLASAADLSNDSVNGLKLGMSLADAEQILASHTVSVQPATGANQALLVEHRFYDCSTLRGVYVPRLLLRNGSGRPTIGQQASPPPGVCTDTATIKLAHATVFVTYLPTVRGDASTQVVARVELVEDADFSHALKTEGMPVHYYEHAAIEKYGAPTYRDPYKAHKDVAYRPAEPAYVSVGAMAVPIDLVNMMRALCNERHCTEHQGMLAWCSGATTATACGRPTAIFDDSLDAESQPLHYEPAPARPGRIDTTAMSPGSEAYKLAVAGREAGARREAKEEDDAWNRIAYAVVPVANRPAQRLVMQFDDAAAMPTVTVILESIELFEKSFPIGATAAPAPVRTPAF